MSIHYARSLTGRERTAAANRHLGFTLAFVAGAINAGGFLAVQQYTSHMTGIVSAMADNIVLGTYDLVLGGLGGLLSFVLGAACSTVMVNYSRRRQLHSEYALPLMLEALLLLCFGFLGATLATITGLFVPLTVMLLCFIMGLQNALITKLSKAEIRTTHITGIITDIGIELGKMLYWNHSRNPDIGRVISDRQRLRVLSLLTCFFFSGAVIGALGFNYLGYISTVPLALLLVLLAAMPALDDARVLIRWLLRR
ncbi:YoaK family protein [Pseudomonas sp. TMP9]|uniref:YoaK family protein n=1 Tax=unclassified Pseudomonas TaxID=196821 RepID=UPI0030CAE88A